MFRITNRPLIAAASLAFGGSTGALAQQATPTAQATGPTELESVLVRGKAGPTALDKPAPTASRLGLTARETPAAIDTIDSRTIEARGYVTVEQAVDSLPGVTSGGSPGSPSQFSMRGFTGDQVTVLRDGLYIGPADMTYRPQNSFNLSSIDVLKGPGSVLYGQGSVAGTVNVLTKKPVLGETTHEAILSYGRFNTVQFGIGGNFALTREMALRLDASRTSSDGFVHHTRSDSNNLTLALLWKPSASFDLQAGLDILHDNPPPYWGTPLVPGTATSNPLTGVVSGGGGGGVTVDKGMRYVNYDVADYQITSTQYLPRLTVHWKPADDIVVTNAAYYLYADRKWKNAETYTYDSGTGKIDRDRFFVFHDQHLSGDQLSAAFTQPVAGLANRFAVGLDYSHLIFTRTRGFQDGEGIYGPTDDAGNPTVPGVDPYNPVAGSFGALAPAGQVPRVSPTFWTDTAVFAEDALDVTPALKLVTGARFEAFKLVRENFGPTGAFQAGTSFTRTFHPFNWRVGAIYQATPEISPYLQYSTGQDPVGSNILLVNAGQNFDLSKSRQVEVGVKASFDAKRGDATLAVYDIDRKNVLMQTSPDTVVSANQKSKGVELAVDYKPVPAWQINANLAYTDSRYGTFFYNGADVSGNRPANIPKWTANLWNSVGGVAGLPLELGAGLRYVADRYGDNANTLKLTHYTLVDVYATYRVTSAWSVTGRVNNVFNKAYAQWVDVNYPTQVQLGAPVTYEVSLVARF